MTWRKSRFLTQPHVLNHLAVLGGELALGSQGVLFVNVIKVFPVKEVGGQLDYVREALQA